MSISNIWITEEYQEKIEELFKKLNVFEVASFFEKHQFRDADKQTEENTQDHDITIVNDSGFEVFIEHLSCYFSDISSTVVSSGFVADTSKVSKELADRSHMGTSWDPEKRAQQEIAGFGQYVQEVYDTLKGHATSIVQKNFLDTEIKRFQDSFAKKYNDLLARKGRTMSTFITGGSNFNVRKADKANDSERKAYDEMIEFRDRAQAAILRELKKMAIGEAGGELEVLKKKIADAKRNHEFMVKTNAIVRKKSTTEQKVKEIQALSPISDKTIHEILTPDYMGRIGFPAFALSNDTANIHRMEGRVLELEKKEVTELADTAFPGGTISDNKAEDRTQIFFDKKPEQAMIDKLKGAGWRWSPRFGSWQRKRTDAAIDSARRILGLPLEASKFITPKQAQSYEEQQKPTENLYLTNTAQGITATNGVDKFLVLADTAKPFLEKISYWNSLTLKPFKVIIFKDNPEYNKIFTFFKANNIEIKKPVPIQPNPSSEDYKAGYNLGIQGRSYPPVPAWTDQGKIDYAAGYTEGKRILYEQDTRKEESIEEIWGKVQPDDEELYGSIEQQMAEEEELEAKWKKEATPIFGQPIKPKETETVVILPPSQTINAYEFGKDYDRIKELIHKGGAEALEEAKRLIEAKESQLTDADRFELADLLRYAEEGLRPMKAPERIHKPAKPKPEISTTRSRARKQKKAEGDEEGEEEESIPTIKRYSFNNLADANEFFKKNWQGIPEMIRVGVPEWIETRKKAAVGKLSSNAVFALGNALEYAMLPIKKPEVRGLVAMDLFHKTKWLIVEHGLDFATKEYDWQKQYGFYKNSIKVDIETFKKDVLHAVNSLDFKIT